MSNKNKPLFDSFGGDLEKYTPKIMPFLSNDYIQKNNLNRDNIREEYEKLSQDALYELDYSYPLIKLFIYLFKEGNQYSISKKFSASHILEQIFDDEGNIVQENLKLKI